VRQRAENIVRGSQVAISGKIVMRRIPRHRTRKKGSTALATFRML
jgi:ribosomal protein S3